MPSVLIVEDDHDIRFSLVELLQLEGYAVFSARNGREALDLLVEIERPGLIILDLQMPVMDGSDFLRAIEARSDRELFSIVVLSALSTVPSLGGVRALRKPIGAENLLALVAEHCGRPAVPKKLESDVYQQAAEALLGSLHR